MLSAANEPIDGSYIVVRAAITGPTRISRDTTATWLATATGGDGSYTYSWQYRLPGAATWTTVGTGASYTRTVAWYDPDFELRVTVTSAGLSAADTHLVVVEPPPVKVDINGTARISRDTIATWQAVATGGNGVYTYSWQYRLPGAAAWTMVGAGATYTDTVKWYDPDFELRVVATSAGRSGADTLLVVVERVALAVTFSGPSSMTAGDTGTWTANPTGGNGTYTYQWQYRPGTGTTWYNGATTRSYSRTAHRTFDLRVIVTSDGETVTSAVREVRVEGWVDEFMCGDVPC